MLEKNTEHRLQSVLVLGLSYDARGRAKSGGILLVAYAKSVGPLHLTTEKNPFSPFFLPPVFFSS